MSTTEYKFDSATVRIHEEKELSREALESACIRFMRAVERERSLNEQKLEAS